MLLKTFFKLWPKRYKQMDACLDVAKAKVL